MQTQKIAFITGGNRGIGFETARQLSRQGILPVIGARTKDDALKAVRALRSENLSAEGLVFDISNSQDHQNAYDFFDSLAGRLDILINNAGIYLDGESGVNDLYTAATVPENILRQSMETNFYGPVLLTQKLLPLLERSSAGRIVNLSSILGSLTAHSDPSAPIFNAQPIAYSASKTAINAFTVHLAKALRGSTVKVNSAHPGWVMTGMGGSAAPMSVEDGAKTSVQLATLPADGPSGRFYHQGEELPW
jgi:NAD(P)-dependent dehydrogenase (short-subunit alcohol dehydrogenase family)